MIMCGKNITAPGDLLSKVQVSYFYNSLVHPRPEIEALIRQLRMVYQLDSKQYSRAKRSLPYVVCGIFKPEYRKIENFAYIEYFIVDIDKISTKEMDVAELRQRLQQDPRVMMSFISPSQDGIKLMFKLRERCTDAGLYSVFYKEFIKRFAAQYSIEQVLDSVTSDVSRACFVSTDPDAYFNPQAETIDINDFVSQDDPLQFFDLKRQQAEEAREAKKQGGGGTDGQPNPHEPEADVMAKIKERLGMKPKAPEQKPVQVPEDLQKIVPELKVFIEQQGMLVTEIKSIQYGKQIQTVLGRKKAEVNVFYGKRGFTTVLSTKSGTDDDLNLLLKQIVEEFLHS